MPAMSKARPRAKAGSPVWSSPTCRVVESDMQLHRALGAREPRLREHRQAQIDGRRVERVQRVAEPEAVPRRRRPAAGQRPNSPS